MTMDADLDPFAPPPQVDPSLPQRAETPPGSNRITVYGRTPTTLPVTADLDPDLDPNALPSSAPLPPQGTPNKTFGTISEADPDWTQWTKWQAGDLLRAGGAQPYPAQHLGNAAVDIAQSGTPLGSILAAGDTVYNLKRGNWGAAAINAVGALPLIGQLKKINAAVRGRPTVPQIVPANTAPPGLQGPPAALGGTDPSRMGFVTPTVPELVGRGRLGEPRGASQRAYDAVSRSPVRYTAQVGDDIAQLAMAHIQHPNIGGFTEQKAPLVYSTLRDFAQAWRQRGTPVTPADLDTLRQALRGLPEANGPAGNRAIDMLDRYMYQPPWWQIVRGTPQDFANVRRNFEVARGNYRSGSTAQTVTEAIDRGATSAGATHSGQNVDNQTRQQLASLIKTRAGREKIFGATPQELVDIWRVSQGDAAANRMRYWGNFVGGNGGMAKMIGASTGGGIGFGLAHAFGLPPSAAFAVGTASAGVPAVVGSALKNASNARTVRAADEMAERIARNSPEYRRRLAAATARGMGPMADPRIVARDAITQALVPQLRDSAQRQWGYLHVPYANRDGSRAPDKRTLPPLPGWPSPFSGWVPALRSSFGG